jgi:ATP/ADP translocase
MPCQFKRHHFSQRAELVFYFCRDQLHALLEELTSFLPFLHVDKGLAHILKKIAWIIAQSWDELQSFIVLQHLFWKMACEVALCAVSLQFVDDSDFIIDVNYIFASFVLGYFDVEVAVCDKFESAVEGRQLLLQSVQQLVHYVQAEKRRDHN